MIDLIEFKESVYPKFQASGNAARFCLPFAMEVCKGEGLDIGYHKPEWKMPGTVGVDDRRVCFKDGTESAMPNVDALHLPGGPGLDFVFSSHCLEHLPNWVEALECWRDMLDEGGTMFLYLPDFSQEYWRPWNNRKHIHAFTPEILRAYLVKRLKKVFVSGVDLNNSFIAIGEK